MMLDPPAIGAARALRLAAADRPRVERVPSRGCESRPREPRQEPNALSRTVEGALLTGEAMREVSDCVESQGLKSRSNRSITSHHRVIASSGFHGWPVRITALAIVNSFRATA